MCERGASRKGGGEREGREGRVSASERGALRGLVSAPEIPRRVEIFIEYQCLVRVLGSGFRVQGSFTIVIRGKFGPILDQKNA